jgi:hypothetical protein
MLQGFVGLSLRGGEQELMQAALLGAVDYNSEAKH